jgi:uncharacterized protein YacL
MSINNENRDNKMNKKENVKIIIITIMKSIITIMIKDIENQIETVNDKMNRKDIENINMKLLGTIIGIFN